MVNGKSKKFGFLKKIDNFTYFYIDAIFRYRNKNDHFLHKDLGMN